MKKALVLWALICTTTLMAERAVYLQTKHTDYWWVTADQEKCWTHMQKDGKDLVDMLYGCKMGYPILIKKKGTKLIPPMAAVAVLIRNDNEPHMLCTIPANGVAIRTIEGRRGIFGTRAGEAVCDWLDPSAAHNISLEYAKTKAEAKKYAGRPMITRHSLSPKGPAA